MIFTYFLHGCKFSIFPVIDTALLFAAQNNTHDSESDDVNSENDDEDLDNDQSCLKHSEFRVPFLHLMSVQSSCY